MVGILTSLLRLEQSRMFWGYKVFLLNIALYAA